MTKAQQLGITKFPYKEYDTNNNIIFYENKNGDWIIYKYNYNNKVIYDEKSDGIWSKYDYDEHGRRIYFENSIGHGFFKYYDLFNNVVRFEKDFKIQYLMYKRNLVLNKLLND